LQAFASAAFGAVGTSGSRTTGMIDLKTGLVVQDMTVLLDRNKGETVPAGWNASGVSDGRLRAGGRLMRIILI
jgi:hypothetical protein